MKKYITNSAESTQKLASDLAQKFQNGAIITLTGPLGAGKTTFVQGFAKALGIKSKILSPTFVLMREYVIPNKVDARLYHLDLYRLEGMQQINNLGLTDLFVNPKNIFLIEWADKITNLPKNKIIKIELEYLTEDSRQITLMD
ncbi:MAG: tRNA (adenosine(37)-N6)-threonylcarbamoyltransferase complex ATPase subunit type 1 TsaE [Microgenomates group bacterium]|jgi:tRNA threonylcarbamoyladenosine biosynthesis protein TsaE